MKEDYLYSIHVCLLAPVTAPAVTDSPDKSTSGSSTSPTTGKTRTVYAAGALAVIASGFFGLRKIYRMCFPPKTEESMTDKVRNSLTNKYTLGVLVAAAVGGMHYCYNRFWSSASSEATSSSNSEPAGPSRGASRQKSAAKKSPGLGLLMVLWVAAAVLLYFFNCRNKEAAVKPRDYLRDLEEGNNARKKTYNLICCHKTTRNSSSS